MQVHDLKWGTAGACQVLSSASTSSAKDSCVLIRDRCQSLWAALRLVRPAPPAEPAIWAHHLVTVKGTHIPSSCTQPQHLLPRLWGRAAGRAALDSRSCRGSAGRAERGGAGRCSAMPELALGRIAPVSWVSRQANLHRLQKAPPAEGASRCPCRAPLPPLMLAPGQFCRDGPLPYGDSCNSEACLESPRASCPA